LVNEKIKEENKLSVDYGAWLARGDDGSPAVASGSAAEKAGLKEGDIILEFNGEKISNDNTLSKMINKYNAGDGVSLKILRSGEEKMLEAVLGQRGE
jgi:S1-C subfamily serine protease